MKRPVDKHLGLPFHGTRCASDAPLSLPFPRYFLPKQRACSQATFKDFFHRLKSWNRLEKLEITAHKQYHRKALLSSFHLMFKGFVKAFDGGLHETTFCP